MAIVTRLSTTVTSRYYPAPDTVDAFFLDGRSSGRREARSADVTTDKEEESFFLSVFSHAPAAGWDPAAPPTFEKPLQNLLDEVKNGRKSLDDQIGNFINTAVSVTGRMRIQSGQSRTPFFSGMIIKDGEAFAVTMGKGLAFLYRDDTLFPLTAADIPMEPMNAANQKVESFYNYCAAKTATALCSNIAQLRMDDCLILCSQTVYDVLGQREMLRLLDEAYDQSDAAGTIITEAAGKAPGVPLQFMISFVESVSETSAKGGFFGFGRKKKTEKPVSSPSTSRTATEIPSMPLEVPVQEVVPTPAVPESTPEEVPTPSFFDTVTEDEKPEEETPAPVYISKEPEEPLVEELQASNASKVTADMMSRTASIEALQNPTPVVEEEPEVSFDIPSAEEDPLPLTTESEKENATSPSDFLWSVPNAAVDVEKKEEPTVSVQQDTIRVGITYVPGDEKDEQASYLMADASSETKEPEKKELSGEDYTQKIVMDAATTLEQGFSFVKEDEEISFQEPAVSEEKEEVVVNTLDEYGKTNDDGFFIPFESEEAVKPLVSSANDVPDMPVYDAPVSSPSHLAGGYQQPGVDTAGAYARGTYELPFDNDEAWGDVSHILEQSEIDFSEQEQDAPKIDVQPRTAPYQPYQSYSSYNNQLNQSSRSERRHDNSAREKGRVGQSQNTNLRNQGRVSNREHSFDREQSDSAYQKNKLFMIILAVLCTVCCIVLVVLVLNGNKDAGNAETPSGTIQSLPVVESSAPPQTDLATLPIGDETGDGEGTSVPDGSENQTDDSSIPENTTVINQEVGAMGTFTFSENLGFRTWWDLFWTHYNMNLHEEDRRDTLIAKIKEYNALPADYTPTPGDTLRVPPSEYYNE